MFLSILPIILPVILISTLSILKITILQDADTAFQESFTKSTLFQTLTFLGEPNIAMALAAIFSFLGCIKKSTDKKFLEAPLITAGSIILITGAGKGIGFDSVKNCIREGAFVYALIKNKSYEIIYKSLFKK